MTITFEDWRKKVLVDVEKGAQDLQTYLEGVKADKSKDYLKRYKR